jgi:hypothetical protein
MPAPIGVPVPVTPTEIDCNQCWKSAYDSDLNLLNTESAGIAVSHGGEKDYEQVIKNVFNIETGRLRISEV